MKGQHVILLRPVIFITGYLHTIVDVDSTNNCNCYSSSELKMPVSLAYTI